MITVLQQEVQLPEHLGEIAPVDFVDDQEVPGVWFLSRLFSHGQQWSGSEPEAGLFVDESGTDALDKVLVSVRRVELHQPHALLTTGEARRQLPRSVGLAGAWWPLKDDLSLVFQQTLDLAKVTGIDQQFVGEFLNR